jgi:hypothetical protein
MDTEFFFFLKFWCGAASTYVGCFSTKFFFGWGGGGSKAKMISEKNGTFLKIDNLNFETSPWTEHYKIMTNSKTQINVYHFPMKIMVTYQYNII